MNRLVFALSILLIGCNQDHSHGHGHDAAHDHGHGHEQATGHAHADAPEEGAGHDHSSEHAQTPEPVSPAAVAPAPAAFPVGSWTATLDPSAQALRLSLVDSAGAEVPPEGEAKVVLSGVGMEEQRLTLPAAEGGWAGPAQATGAKGYTAVVNVTVGGITESGKVSWGEMPKAQPAPAPHHHGEAGHDHGGKGHHQHSDHGADGG